MAAPSGPGGSTLAPGSPPEWITSRERPACIGAGIFALAGPEAKNHAGPAVSISFILAGIASACAALAYAEFGGLIPKAGSAYAYGYAVLGEAVGWAIGWDLLLEYIAIVAVVAILLCLGVAWLLNRGIKSSARIKTYLVFVKIAIVLAVIVVGAFYIMTENLTPFTPFGFGGIATGAATGFFAAFGYDAMSTAAEESKDAERNLQKAIIWSLGIAMVL